MVMCWAFGCNHYNERDTCRFFRFPKDGKLRKQWIIALKRTDEPGPGAFICSCHFKDGQKENGPEIFSFNQKKRFSVHYLSPEKKRVKLSKPQMTPQIMCFECSNTPSTSRVSTICMHLPPTIAEDSTIRSAPIEELEAIRKFEVSTQTSETLTGIPEFSPLGLEAENVLLQLSAEKDKIKLKYLDERFSYTKIMNDDKLVTLYTGLPLAKLFETLYNLMEDIELNYMYGFNVEKLNKKDQLLLVLMKLRQNFPHADLAVRFNVSEATVSNIVITWIHALYEVLYEQLMKDVPSREKNKLCLPNSFSSFTNCRIILDCTEIYTSVPRKSLATQKITYSAYKHRNTLKGLVGTSPNGVITFVSNLYPGSVSDKQIVKTCGILDIFQPGDLILADKGFLIRDILPPGVSLNIPPFLTSAQFTTAQIRQTEAIAKARIHVERAIRRMKCYNILDFIPHNLTKYADVIFKVVAALTNLQFPLIRELEYLFKE